MSQTGILPLPPLLPFRIYLPTSTSPSLPPYLYLPLSTSLPQPIAQAQLKFSYSWSNTFYTIVTIMPHLTSPYLQATNENTSLSSQHYHNNKRGGGWGRRRKRRSRRHRTIGRRQMRRRRNIRSWRRRVLQHLYINAGESCGRVQLRTLYTATLQG